DHRVSSPSTLAVFQNEIWLVAGENRTAKKGLGSIAFFWTNMRFFGQTATSGAAICALMSTRPARGDADADAAGTSRHQRPRWRSAGRRWRSCFHDVALQLAGDDVILRQLRDVNDVCPNVQAIFCRRRHQPSKPPTVSNSPGTPLPTAG